MTLVLQNKSSLSIGIGFMCSTLCMLVKNLMWKLLALRRLEKEIIGIGFFGCNVALYSLAHKEVGFLGSHSLHPNKLPHILQLKYESTKYKAHKDIKWSSSFAHKLLDVCNALFCYTPIMKSSVGLSSM